jgi:hypothetical protein
MSRGYVGYRGSVGYDFEEDAGFFVSFSQQPVILSVSPVLS